MSVDGHALVVEHLRAVQDEPGHLPAKELAALAAKLSLPVYELHGVATFYPQFRMTPAPRAALHVCTDMACHMRQSEAMLTQLRELASKSEGIEVRNCSCLGQCDRAPAMLINDQPFAGGSPAELVEISKRAIEGVSPEAQAFLPAARGPFRTDPYESAEAQYDVIRALVQSGDYAGVADKLKAANLRGMGGGGFPAHIKWSSVRSQPAGAKYIVCNADEAEVGTFKDRELIKNLPHLLVEAMAIAAITCGAHRGFIYLRHEYHEQLHILEAEIARAYAIGILGKDAAGSGKSFDLSVFASPGGYVQGEETALLEAIEGKRGQPRNKPTIPAIAGLWQKPTLINNVETFCYVPVILSRGPDWFKSQGKNGAEGLKWIGVGGDVNQPGVFEVSMGTTYAEAIELAGGVLNGLPLKAFAPSGPSFGLIPAAWANTPMDFPTGKNPISDVGRRSPDDIAPIGTTVGSAAILIYAQGRDMVDAALNFTRFYRNESCGKCVPCRVGSQKIVDLIASVMAGNASADELKVIDDLAFTLDMTSICGLGQVVSTPIKWVMKHFADEIAAYAQKTHAATPSAVTGAMRTTAAGVVALGIGGGAKAGKF